jgi:uncharacterized Tic20 family protein
MTTHPPEPPAPWPPSPDEQPASQAERPGAPDEWRPFERPTADQRGNGHRAAAAARGAPVPLADYPPEHGYEPAPGQPPGPGYGPDDYPDYPATPGYPDLPGYSRDGYEPASYPPMPDYPPADYPPMPDYPAADHPSMPDYSPAPGYPPTPGYSYPHGSRAAPGSPDAAYLPTGPPAADYPRGGYPAKPQEAEFPTADGSWVLEGGSWVLQGGSWVLQGGSWVLEGAPVTHEEYTHPGDVPASAVHTPPDAAPADAAPADAAPATGPDGARWAMLAYLTVPFFGFLVPLTVYLIFLRRSRWLRAHAAQAINVWVTSILYLLSALIIGTVLMLDSPHVALAVVVPLVIALWLTTLAFLVRAAAWASRGETYTVPRWLCTPVVR